MKLIDVEVKIEADIITVTPVFDGVDRPNCFSWGLKSTDRKLADRLSRAIKAGVVLIDLQVRKDIDGKTFVSHNSKVSGRTLNADLKRLGF